jgi:hypothetical protein
VEIKHVREGKEGKKEKFYDLFFCGICEKVIGE